MTTNNIQMTCVSGVDSDKSELYLNNIKMQFQNGRLNVASKEGKEWGDNLYNSMMQALPTMQPAGEVIQLNPEYDDLTNKAA